MKMVKRKDLVQAILNWQNTVGTGLNGQLEAFLGLTLGDVDDNFYYATDMTDEGASRVEKLLSENHPTMIKVWLARNK